MSILVDANTRVVVQGITGREGGNHARRCIEYGTNIVAGVTPGKAGQKFDDKIPIFDSVKENYLIINDKRVCLNVNTKTDFELLGSF